MDDPCYTQLLEQLNGCTDETLWIVDENLPASFIHSVTPRPSLHALTNRVDTHRTLRSARIDTELNDFLFEYPADSFERIVYRVSKERALVHHCINRAVGVLKNQGEMILVGQKKDGLKTHLRNGEQVFGHKSVSRKHGLCYTGTLQKGASSPGHELPSHDYPNLRQISADDFSFFSKPGIFGWNKVDRGSKLLVEVLQNRSGDFNTTGRLLDLGCGWGYLTLASANLPFSERVATDNNVTALVAAQYNFEHTGLDVTTLADDCGSEISQQFDLILCNPPFHQGFSVSGDLSNKFVQQTARLLAHKGDALFVVNQFIPLEKLAQQHFADLHLVAHEAGFKVFALSNRK